MTSRLDLPSAKQSRIHIGNPWFPYYAGFSPEFVSQVLQGLPRLADKVVLDPWNGAGTTTFAASGLARQVYGFDLNPSMTIAARARLLGRDVTPSLIPLSREIVSNAARDISTPGDPLALWLSPKSAAVLRALEQTIHRTLVLAEYSPARDLSWVDRSSSLAAFFYVALFRTARRLVSRFGSANPAWVRAPRSPRMRARPPANAIHQAFLETVEQLATAAVPQHENDSHLGRSIHVGTADSRRLPISRASVDAVVTSPPYCTRLDYARATRVELAVLRVGSNDEAELRHRLIGTTSIGKVPESSDVRWGDTCLRLLDQISRHPSRASSGYYLRNHLQYFSGLFESLTELDRVLKPAGSCTIVIQDSWYKDVHTDLAAITKDMCSSNGWRFVGRDDHQVKRTYARINPLSSPAARSGAVESTLVFQKPN